MKLLFRNFFSECSINGDPCVEGEDGIYAFTSDGVCTGGGDWGGTTIEIPVMGSDATNYTSGCSIQAYTDEDECESNDGVWGDYLGNGDMILELKGGTCKKLGIKEGESILF